MAALARGCAVLGTGGGGDAHTGILIARQALSQYGPVPLVALGDLDPDGVLLPVGAIGAPSVSLEKLHAGHEIDGIRREVEHVTGRPVVGLMATEIGGTNGLLPVAWAARTGLPLVDADAIGRALPEVQMVSMHVVGRHPDLIVLADERLNVVVLRPTDGHWAEALARSVAVVFGGSAIMADYVMTVAEAEGAIIEGSVSLALSIGRAVEGADDAVAGLIAAVQGTKLIEGKVLDVERRTTGGFVRGSLVVEGSGDDSGRLLRIEIQNENLVALEDGEVLASVPDLISVVDAATGDAIANENIRYGQRVVAIASPSPAIWRTPAGLEIAGPRAFGYDFDFSPLEARHDINA